MTPSADHRLAGELEAVDVHDQPTPVGEVPVAELVETGAGGGHEPRRDRRLAGRTGRDLADGFEGCVGVVPVRHPRQGGGDHVLGQQVHRLDRVPRVQADLPGPISGPKAGLVGRHPAAAQRHRRRLRSVPCRRPARIVTAFRAGLLGDFSGEELAQHAEPDRHRRRQQAIAHLGLEQLELFAGDAGKPAGQLGMTEINQPDPRQQLQTRLNT
jgi:hypothetical protein